MMPANVRELMARLACPACHVRLDAAAGELLCSRCGARYPLVDGIPVLLAGSASFAGGQNNFYDEAVDDEWEVRRPYGAPRFHGQLLEDKLERSVAGLEYLLPGAVAVTSCGGSGMEAEFLARRGAAVLSVDLSLGAVRRARARARARDLPVLAVVAAAERLPLADRGVDIAYVHDGLHHLLDPGAGLAELGRVADRALSVTEPTQAALTALAARLGARRMGFALEVEEAGNIVARLDPEEIAHALTAGGYRVLNARRYAMIYRHEPGRPSHLLSRRRLLPLARRGTVLLGAALDPVGNKLTVQAERVRHAG